MKSRYIALFLSFLLCAQSAMASQFANTVVFGGRGEDGDVTKSGSESTPIVVNARKFLVTGTWTPKSGTIVNASNDVSITGTVNVATNLQTITPDVNRGGYNAKGAGIGAGIGVDRNDGSFWTGGSGAGFGGKGGNSGRSTGVNEYSVTGGPAYTPDAQPCGSSGGNGGYQTFASTAIKAGGAGGGAIKFYCASNLSISGSGVVNINGGAGEAAGSGVSGGGGGSGGYGLFAAVKSISVTATNGVRAKGGAGGNGSGDYADGAGGGGGYLIFVSPSVTLTGGTDLTGGSPGSGGTVVQAALAGDSGVSLIIQGMPTLPLIGAIDTPEKVQEFLAYLAPSAKRICCNEALVYEFLNHKKKHLNQIQSPLSYLDRIREIGEYGNVA